jgi:CspA family cold shock protein
VLTSPDVAGDVWVHFSDTLGDGYRELATGEPVEFRYEEREQDGYRYAAISVRRLAAAHSCRSGRSSFWRGEQPGIGNADRAFGAREW